MRPVQEWWKRLKSNRVRLFIRALFYGQFLVLAYSFGILAAAIFDFFSPNTEIIFPEPKTYYVTPDDLGYKIERYKALALGNFFNTQSAPPGTLEGDKTLSKASLEKVVLTGTFVWINQSFAILRFEDHGGVVAKGQKIPGTEIELSQVERGQVLVSRGPENKWVSMVQPSKTNTTTTGEALPPIADSAQGGIVLSPANNGRQDVRISQDRLELELKNFAQFLNQARVIPNFDLAGKPDGYSIRNIVPGSIYEQLGLQNEDVIKSVNGKVIDSPEKALELFKILRNEKNVQLSLTRGGNPLNLAFHIN